MQLRPVGPDAVLVEVSDAAAAAALALWARRHDVAALDVVPTATSVLFDGVRDVEALRALLVRAPTTPDLAPGAETVEVAVDFDGPDLAFVAAHRQISQEQVVALMCEAELVSAFCGFAPGFAYLAGLPGTVPRLDSPRPRVEAGAVALGDTWCGIYPTASPGGWRVVGRTDAVLWDTDRDVPATLAPGTRVRLVAR